MMKSLLRILRPFRRLKKLEAFRIGMIQHLNYIAIVDGTKIPKVNQAKGGIMPPIGSRLFTPREKANQLLEAMEKNL